VPFVLRAQKTERSDQLSYRIVGPVFIHGLMNSERVAWDELEWQDLVII